MRFASQLRGCVVHKADPIDKSDLALSPSGRIEISLNIVGIKANESTEAAMDRAIFFADAEKMKEVLLATLPAGTIDALLVLLLEHKASSMRVPYKKIAK